MCLVVIKIISQYKKKKKPFTGPVNFLHTKCNFFLLILGGNVTLACFVRFPLLCLQAFIYSPSLIITHSPNMLHESESQIHPGRRERHKAFRQALLPIQALRAHVFNQIPIYELSPMNRCGLESKRRQTKANCDDLSTH